MGAIVLGAVAGVVCLWAVTGLKKAMGYDDSLDVFGVHAVGGVIGAIGTGIVAAPALGGSGVFDYAAGKVGEYVISTQVISQLWGVGTVVVLSGVVSLVLFKLIDLVIGLRVTEEAEREGLDIAEHGEKAYNP
jgi:Amt family ammonium transporter